MNTPTTYADTMAALARELTAEPPFILHSYNVTCPKCGRKAEHFSRKPMERGEYLAVCDRCTEGDAT